MLALAATFIGFSAFKFADKLALQPGWYPVEEQGAGDQNLNFTSDTPVELEQEDCEENIEGEHCAVYLTFPGTAPSTLIGMSVEDADEDANIGVGNRAYREE